MLSMKWCFVLISLDLCPFSSEIYFVGRMPSDLMYIRVRSVYIRVQRDPLTTHHMFIDARAELPTRTDNRWPFHFQEIRFYTFREFNLSGYRLSRLSAFTINKILHRAKSTLVFFLKLFWCVISFKYFGSQFLSVNTTSDYIRIYSVC